MFGNGLKLYPFFVRVVKLWNSWYLIKFIINLRRGSCTRLSHGRPFINGSLFRSTSIVINFSGDWLVGAGQVLSSERTIKPCKIKVYKTVGSLNPFSQCEHLRVNRKLG